MPRGEDSNPAKPITRSDRDNRVLLPFWATKESRKRLKHLAINEERTQQDLLTEALELLFQDREESTTRS